MATQIVNKPSFLEHKKRRFLIIDAPTDRNIALYLREFAKYGVTDVVRACDPSYSTESVVASGVEVHEMAFRDGDPPPAHVLKAWLALCDARFQGKSSSNEESKQATIAVHCVAGLGRAPVLVSVALIEAGMQPLEAVEFVRKHRRGAINTRQLTYLKGYKRTSGGCCTIM